jgi:peroxiredoxin
MKAIYVAVFLVMLSSTSSAQALMAGDQAPTIELIGHDGQLVTIASTESKLIILDFWASWCRPCLKSVETTLKPLYDSYDRADLEIIGISNDLDETKWRKAIGKWGLDWKNVWDEDKSLVRNYKVPAIPTYFIVNRSGEILAANVYSNDLKSTVRKLMKK